MASSSAANSSHPEWRVKQGRDHRGLLYIFATLAVCVGLITLPVDGVVNLSRSQVGRILIGLAIGAVLSALIAPRWAATRRRRMQPRGTQSSEAKPGSYVMVVVIGGATPVLYRLLPDLAGPDWLVTPTWSVAGFLLGASAYAYSTSTTRPRPGRIARLLNGWFVGKGRPPQ